MQKLRRKKFGEILIAERVITREQLAQTLAVQKQTGESVGEVLLRENIISESDVVRCICTQYQLPFLRPTNYDRDAKLLDGADAEFLFINRMLPLETIGNCMLVAIASIPTEESEIQLREMFEKDVYYYFCMATELETILREQFGLGQEDVMQLETQRRGGRRGGAPQETAPTAAATAQSAATAVMNPGEDGSDWESIFDEAENNL